MARPTERADAARKELTEAIYECGNSNWHDAQTFGVEYVPPGSQVITPEDIQAGWRVLTPEQAEEQVEWVAAALYEQSMGERRLFSSTPERFSRPWGDGQGGDGWRRSWRERARMVLAGVPGKDSA